MKNSSFRRKKNWAGGKELFPFLPRGEKGALSLSSPGKKKEKHKKGAAISVLLQRFLEK